MAMKRKDLELPSGERQPRREQVEAQRGGPGARAKRDRERRFDASSLSQALANFLVKA